MARDVATTRYALWLVPESEARQQLARVIRRLSREYQTPAFAPHVTLVAGIVAPEAEVVGKAARVAREIAPLRIRFTGYGWTREYFRCVFARAAKTRDLCEANRRARKVFELGRQRPLMPHLSLVYGNLPPRTKRGIIASLPKSLLRPITAARLELFRIRGTPNEWKRVRRWRLQRL